MHSFKDVQMQHYYAYETRSLSSCKTTTVEIYKSSHYGEYIIWGEEDYNWGQQTQISNVRHPKLCLNL